MIDGIINETGNSRYLRSVSNLLTLYPTYEDFAAALVAGTLPIDLAGINEAGWQQIGTDLRKLNLLNDSTATLIFDNPTGDETVDDAFRQLAILRTPFSTGDWSVIDAICSLGLAESVFSKGDTREEVLSNGETITLRIEDFEHDELADGSGFASMTFVFENALVTQQSITGANSNVGGWNSSSARTYGNTTVKGWLPESLQNIIRSVKKYTTEGNMSTEVTTTYDDLFLLSSTEVGTDSTVVEGTPYPLFTNDTSRIKYRSAAVSAWGLRTAAIANTANFYYITTTGSSTGQSGVTNTGMVFGFCIGKAE